MACQQLWFTRGCTVHWMFVVLSMLDVLALKGYCLTNADSDYSYYSYDVSSKTKRSTEDLMNRLLALSSADFLLERQSNPVIPLTIIFNVTNSTTSTFSVVATTPAAVPVGAVEQTKPGKNVSFVVSQSMNPAVGLPSQGVIWANRTMLKNVTDQSLDETKASESTTAENSDIDDISIGKFSINKFDMNKILTQNNITKVEEDTHLYYNSTIITSETVGKQLWVDMDNHPNIKVNDLLSQSHRRAATVKLKFDFPFYGHKIRNITIATGGFLHTGEHVHSSLGTTQYIAPLMANFDTRLSNESFVKYTDNGTAFTVEWDKVILQDKPNAGPFTFQATLHQNGDIVFVYSVLPLVVENIEDTAHSVKVGLSDAYVMNRTLFFASRRTIYEYHRISFKRQHIHNWTVIYLRALPTCFAMDNCNDCLTRPTGFDCKWCPKLNMCSTGTFWQKQNWLENGCDVNSIVQESNCPARRNATIYKDHIDTQDRQNGIRSDEELSASVEPSQQDSTVYNYNVPLRTKRSTADLPHLPLASSFAGSLPRRRRTPESDLTITSNVQQQQQPVINTNPKVPSVNVTYSTDEGSSSSTTTAFATMVTTPAAVPVGAVEQTKPGKNVSFVVSQPMNPAVGLPSQGVIWANRTMLKNVTDESLDETKTSESTTAENSDIDDISIGKFSINKFDMNKTLTQNKITKIEEDTHLYYNSTIITNETVGKQLWVDMDNHPDVKVNDLLSQSHRRAATVKLKFDFPFYGHKVRNITIATGGFLYTGEYVHSWLAATQYIAPLMANFDTRLSNESFVKYADNGTAFTVEWDKVILQDKPNAGPFTFQATLHQNGDIVFVYSVVPLVVENIEDTAHPVKVGLSDAYIMDRTVFFIRRKTIYEYHRVNFNRQDIQNWTVIYLRALSTCLEMDNCNDCLTRPTGFDCKWCPKLNMCSTGTFRHRQNWLKNGCDVNSIVQESSCPARINATTYKEHVDTQDRQSDVRSDGELSASVEPSQQATNSDSLNHGARNNIDMGVSGIIGIFIVIALFGGLGAWGAYAYRNPHSTSGQMLIRYRPSQWSWRRGEARYTAATIHM